MLILSVELVLVQLRALQKREEAEIPLGYPRIPHGMSTGLGLLAEDTDTLESAKVEHDMST